jgi:2,4-dichlorophenol 6-monooxygenase
VGRGRFTLLTGVSGSSWVEAAARTSAETGVEVRALQVGPGCEVIDTFGDWAMQSEVSDSGCVLVRPDGYVGWRAHMLSSEPTAELTRVMKSILGTA